MSLPSWEFSLAHEMPVCVSMSCETAPVVGENAMRKRLQLNTGLLRKSNCW